MHVNATCLSNGRRAYTGRRRYLMRDTVHRVLLRRRLPAAPHEKQPHLLDQAPARKHRNRDRLFRCVAALAPLHCDALQQRSAEGSLCGVNNGPLFVRVSSPIKKISRAKNTLDPSTGPWSTCSHALPRSCPMRASSVRVLRWPCPLALSVPPARPVSRFVSLR